MSLSRRHHRRSTPHGFRPPTPPRAPHRRNHVKSELGLCKLPPTVTLSLSPFRFLSLTVGAAASTNVAGNGAPSLPFSFPLPSSSHHREASFHRSPFPLSPGCRHKSRLPPSRILSPRIPHPFLELRKFRSLSWKEEVRRRERKKEWKLGLWCNKVSLLYPVLF